jgi:hypothetical protein
MVLQLLAAPGCVDYGIIAQIILFAGVRCNAHQLRADLAGWNYENYQPVPWFQKMPDPFPNELLVHFQRTTL